MLYDWGEAMHPSIRTVISNAMWFAIVLTAASVLVACARATAEPEPGAYSHVVIDDKGPRDPWGKSIGDINGDGLPDLIVGGRAGGGLVWYENPTWRKHVIAADGEFSTDHEVADVDGDGRKDVVSLSVSSLVWFRNPDWKMTLIDNQSLHDIEVADLDGDGRVDIVGRGQSAFGGGGDRVLIYMQRAEGGWDKRSYAVPPGEGLKIADLDQDNRADIVINGVWLRNPGLRHREWSLLRYTSSWTWPHTTVDVGDINGDGRPDIVLAPSEHGGARYRIAWFEAPTDITAKWSEHVIEDNVEAVHHFVGIADFDHDGRGDVVSAMMHQGRAPQEIKIYLNQGGGQAWTKQVIATTGSHNMRVVDIDNDGDPDLFGANWSGRHQPVELWVNRTCSANRGCPRWRRHVIDGNRPGKAVFVSSADLDGDGRLDLAAGSWWYRNPGRPVGNWDRRAIGDPAHDAVLRKDLDGDGDIDVLATRWREAKPDARFVFAENDGRGHFRLHTQLPAGAGDFLQGVATGRFKDSAGLQVALSWHAGGKGVQLLTIPRKPISEPWHIETITDFSQDEALSAGDIDRDGHPDLLLGTVWLRNERDRWTTFRIDPAANNPDRNRLADINRDGRLDAVVGFEAISKPGDVVWYEQAPDPTAAWQRHHIGTVVGPMSLDVADLDDDGDLDVVVGEHNLQEPSSALLVVFENADGVGSAWRRHLVHMGDEHHDGALAIDLDGDGDLDIVSIGWGHGKVLWYENLGFGRQGLPDHLAINKSGDRQ